MSDNENITELHYLLTSEEDLGLYTLYFEDGYEITFDNNNVPHLWKGKSFEGVYDSLYTDLVEYDGIVVLEETKNATSRFKAKVKEFKYYKEQK